jgi:hypothetical protein
MSEMAIKISELTRRTVGHWFVVKNEDETRFRKE